MSFGEYLQQRVVVESSGDGSDQHVISGVVSMLAMDAKGQPAGTMIRLGALQTVLHEGLSIGSRFLIGDVTLPPGYQENTTHVHPGGEIIIVGPDGAYQDVALDGRVLQHYPPGTIAAYSHFSTHRPVSAEGAQLLYLSFDGQIHGSPEQIVKRAINVGAKGFPDALEYMLGFLFPEPSARQVIMDLYEISQR